MTGTTQDQQAAPEFQELATTYRRELLAHCYRMTGSVHEAEDLVQETYLRAWRAYHGFEGRSSVRTWLYRIATNVCLTNLEGRNRRPLPTGLGTADSQAGDALEMDHEVPWLEPVPDAAVVVEERDSIRLAFIAALQHLPARQRAVLILRDVLRWSAREVAEALDTTAVAVNSALQRAHAQMEQVHATQDTVEPELDARQRLLLDEYVEAFWRKDIDTIVSMLTADAVWEMPPFTGWYRGAANIGRLIDTQCPGGSHDMPMLRTSANGQPAFALYMHHPDGDFRPFHLQVLDLDGDKVRGVVAFFGPDLFARSGSRSASPPRTCAPSGTPRRRDRLHRPGGAARARDRLCPRDPRRRTPRPARPAHALRRVDAGGPAGAHVRLARRAHRGQPRRHRGRAAAARRGRRRGRRAPRQGLPPARRLVEPARRRGAARSRPSGEHRAAARRGPGDRRPRRGTSARRRAPGSRFRRGWRGPSRGPHSG